MTSAVCVFAVCRTGTSAGLSTTHGHPQGGPVTLLALDDHLSAVVQEVPAARFTEEALKERLSDRAELEACARAHHATVSAAAARGSVVPLPLATLFTDQDRARSALSECLPRFREALAHVEGRAEWAIKVYLRQDPHPPPVATATPAPASATVADVSAGRGAGRAYLARVRDREGSRRDRRDTGVAAAGRVHRAAAAAAVGCVQRRPHGQDITGKQRLQVMNAAYLVDQERAGDLRAAVDALTGDLTAIGVEVEVSGPWVPYSFTEPSDAVAAQDTTRRSAS